MPTPPGGQYWALVTLGVGVEDPRNGGSSVGKVTSQGPCWLLGSLCWSRGDETPCENVELFLTFPGSGSSAVPCSGADRLSGLKTHRGHTSPVALGVSATGWSAWSADQLAFSSGPAAWRPDTGSKRLSSPGGAAAFPCSGPRLGNNDVCPAYASRLQGWTRP